MTKGQTKLNAIILKFIIMNAIGIFVFFVPVAFMGKSSIPLDHIVNCIKNYSPLLTEYYAFLIIIAGALYPFITKNWRKSKISVIFSIFKVLGVFIAFSACFEIGPNFLLSSDMAPFLFKSLVISVGLIVPVGAMLLSFLIDYGLLEFFGVLMQPIMRTLFKTPGKSAIDALASFVGSYSVGLMITDKVYQEGYYTSKEASIIATGFSTVSVTFMIIVINAVGLTDYWNHFFWPTIIITFLITAITVRIYPLKNIANKYYDSSKPDVNIKMNSNYWKTAWKLGMSKVENATPLISSSYKNFINGILLTMNILPMIMSIGLVGLMLNKYTPVFEYIGYIFYPFSLLVKLPEPLIASKAVASSIAEMFLPSLLLKSTGTLNFVTCYTVASISISSIIFFSASIPCILSTKIPLTLKNLIIVWFERVILGIIITTPAAYLVKYLIAC